MVRPRPEEFPYLQAGARDGAADPDPRMMDLSFLQVGLHRRRIVFDRTFHLMAQRRNGRGVADAALADELAAGFDHELLAVHLAEHLAAGDDLESHAVDLAVQVAADDHVVGANIAVEAAGGADRNVAGRLDRTFDDAVDVEGGLERQFASEFTSSSDNRRPDMLNLSFTAFANESHLTRPSFSNRVSYLFSDHCMNGSGSRRRCM